MFFHPFTVSAVFWGEIPQKWDELVITTVCLLHFLVVQSECLCFCSTSEKVTQLLITDYFLKGNLITPLTTLFHNYFSQKGRMSCFLHRTTSQNLLWFGPHDFKISFGFLAIRPHCCFFFWHHHACFGVLIMLHNQSATSLHFVTIRCFYFARYFRKVIESIVDKASLVTIIPFHYSVTLKVV